MVRRRDNDYGRTIMQADSITGFIMQKEKLRSLIHQVSELFTYCGRRDLNPHDRNDHKILSLARLPVPTLPHSHVSQHARSIVASGKTNVNKFF